eukprot:TRINITY_DN15426_c0_g1_i1.p1 TRINITY_DN15426_c0_g1~~TRINITY_DN15426_c0_g1_i1.p1  ORF type:complete len:355 (+),score=46.48 TRINITY_DN15426_c0_g1_i1:64-1065(+)
MGLTSSKPGRRATEPRVRADYRINPAKAGSKEHAILLSKNILDFGLSDKPCPVGSPVNDEITIINNTEEKLHFKFEPIASKTCKLTCNPSQGAVKKNKRVTIHFIFEMNQPDNINSKVTLNVEGEAHFIRLKVRSDTGVFGCDPSSLETIDDAGFRVPRILAMMKEALITNGGLESEGIFRLAGEALDIKQVKVEMNANQFTGNYDVNTLASLIKIWFRELPVPILNVFPKEVIEASDPQAFVEAYDNLVHPNKVLMDWLIDFLNRVAEKQDINKMSAQNLAIVLAPNLYEPTGTDPMEGLVLSQKCAQLLTQLLISRHNLQSAELNRTDEWT